MDIEEIQFYIEGVVLLIFGIFGTIGNVAAIVVFARQNLQKSFHALMLSLAAFDLLFITTCVLIYCIPQFSLDYAHSAGYKYSFPWVKSIAEVAMTGSIYFTMAITIERYVTVCHPFYRVSHSWPAKNIVLPIVAFSIIYNVPKFFELKTIEKGFIITDGQMYPHYAWNLTDLRTNHYYYHIYKIWLNFLLMSLGPFIILVVLNALMLRELIKLAKDNNVTIGLGSSSNRSKDIILAKVSMAIVFVFILCHTFRWIPNVNEMLHLDEKDFEPEDWVNVITHVSHAALVFNSSVNFYIYFTKHWRTICNLPESRASNQTEMTRLQKSSVVTHKISQISQTQQLYLDDPNQTLLSSIETK